MNGTKLGAKAGKWFEAAERLSAAINSLLELRDEPGKMPRRWCSVHNREEFKYESLEHELRAAPTPSQRARDAEKIALAIVEEITPHIDAYSRLGHDWKGQIAAKVIKHLPAAETVGEREED